MEKVYMSQREFGRALGMITHQVVMSDEDYDGVYGIPRGGLVPAVYLSHRLSLDYVHRVSDITEDTLVVDDISDTGATLEDLLGTLKVVPDIACLYTTGWTSVQPTYWVHEKPTEDCWIVFPWETARSTK